MESAPNLNVTPPAPPISNANLGEILGTTATAAAADFTSQMGDDYRIQLPVFEGPLDLLLHLIRREQLNIYDIPVASICKNYLEHLELMCAPDCNVAGEFFVMAASLIQLKSQLLLPKEETAT